MPSTKDYAWCAGFFDGEGSTTFHRGSNKNQKFAPRLRIGQSGTTGDELLRKFRKIVGVGKVYGPYAPRKSQKQIVWAYQVSNRSEVAKVLRLMWPYLGSNKKKQALEVLRPT